MITEKIRLKIYTDFNVCEIFNKVISFTVEINISTNQFANKYFCYY